MDNDENNPFPIPPQVPINQEIEAIGHLQTQDIQPHSSAKQNCNQSSQPKPRLEKYYQKRTNLIHNNKLNLNEPYIKVTVTLTFNQQIYSDECFINQKGLVGSLKTADSEDIIIGRSHSAEVNSNDIILENKRISRIHCKLVCKDYFRDELLVKLIYTLALYSIRTQSNFPLPQRARQIISQFLDKPKCVYVQDLGSATGTQLSIQKNIPYIMKYDQKYCFGNNSNCRVKFCQSFNEEGIEIDDHFFQLLKKINLLKQYKHEIYFSDKQVLDKFRNIYQQQVCVEDSQNKTKEYKEIYDKLKEYKASFISLKFKKQDIKTESNYNIFIHLDNQDSNEIYIGRSKENHIIIQSDVISRKQCRFKYLKRYNWQLSQFEIMGYF